MMISQIKQSLFTETGVEVLFQSIVSHHQEHTYFSLSRITKFRAFSPLFPLAFFLVLCTSQTVVLAKTKASLEVQLIESEGIMNFVFIDRKKTVKLEDVQVEKDLSNRLKFTVDGHKCQRSWQKSWRAKGLKRALLYPSKKQKTRCFLKVKMSRKISKQQLKAIVIKERSEEGVLLQFAWDPKVLSETAVDLIDDKDSNEEILASGDNSSKTPTSLQNSSPAVAKRLKALNQAVELVVDQDEVTAEEPSQPAPSLEADVGEFANMEVTADQLGMQERPHSMIETVIIGQVEKARAFSPAPIILSTPISIDTEAGIQHSSFLHRASLLLTKLLDQEALSRGGSIWVINPELRAQISHLNTNIPKLSLSQEKSLANHVGAQLISRAELSLSNTQSDELNLAIFMSPIQQDGVLQDSDPGVYRVKHKLSKAMLQEALAQTWVEYKKEDVILRSLLLPGLGQIYQGDKRLGWTYLSSSIGLALGAIISSTFGYLANQDYQKQTATSAHRRDDANAHYDRANLLWLGLGTVYLTSAIDAMISAQDRSYLDIDRLDWSKVRNALESKRGH